MTSGFSQCRFRPMRARYDMRRDEDGWTVFDIWTGWPALIKDTEQTGLDIEQADDLVDLLNTLNERREPLP
jgi:hypothetical protein